MLRILFSTLLYLAFVSPAGAAQAVVDSAFVKGALARGAILWDVRDAKAYGKGHIPGAVNIGAIGNVLRDPNTEDYLPTSTIEQILGVAGIDPSKEIVVYGSRGNPYAYFGLFTVRYFGGDKVHVYHGGIDAWRAMGGTLTTKPTTLPPVKLALEVDPSVAVSTPDVVADVGEGKVQIVDVRTPPEFQGKDVRAIRGGHIPGAVNIPYQNNWVDPETPIKLKRKQVKDNAGMALKAKDALKALYSELDTTKETVVYCQSGVRASETATVLRDLGFKDVKVYDSSWLGYGNTLDAPAEDVSFFNVGRMKQQIKALQAQLRALEARIPAPTATKPAE
jgi:thiosulfate/3-mercaptopyruvate sulfurtransferase